MEIPKIIAEKKAFQLLKTIKRARKRFYTDVAEAALFVNVGDAMIQQYCLYPEVKIHN